MPCHQCLNSSALHSSLPPSIPTTCVEEASTHTRIPIFCRMRNQNKKRSDVEMNGRSRAYVKMENIWLGVAVLSHLSNWFFRRPFSEQLLSFSWFSLLIERYQKHPLVQFCYNHRNSEFNRCICPPNKSIYSAPASISSPPPSFKQ